MWGREEQASTRAQMTLSHTTTRQTASHTRMRIQEFIERECRRKWQLQVV